MSSGSLLPKPIYLPQKQEPTLVHKLLHQHSLIQQNKLSSSLVAQLMEDIRLASMVIQHLLQQNLISTSLPSTILVPRISNSSVVNTVLNVQVVPKNHLRKLVLQSNQAHCHTLWRTSILVTSPLK